jgi:MFS family permease
VLSLGYTDKLNMRFGPRNVLIAGLGLLLVAMLLFARAPVDGNYLVDVFPTMIIFGAGAGVAFPALMMLAMSGATPSDAGLASGLVNTTGQVGGAIGLALLATISTERTQALLDDGESTASALTGGFHVAYLIGAALAVVAIIAAVTVMRAEKPMAMAAGEAGEPAPHGGEHGAPGAEPAYSSDAA